MTSIKNILDFFETFAPLNSAMDFDNVGLLVGDKETNVTNVLVSLDITNDVVNEAKQLDCQLIISHHPVIFNPLKSINSQSVVYNLIKNNICAVCMHTNLDLSTTFGVNTCLANAVGLHHAELSNKGECLFYADLPNSCTINELANTVKTNLNCNNIRYTAVKQNVKRIAVSSGAGGSNIFDCASINADVLITGEIKHHEINFANENKINIIDVGHFKSEDVVIIPLINKLSNQFSQVKFTKSKTYDDFIKFI